MTLLAQQPAPSGVTSRSGDAPPGWCPAASSPAWAPPAPPLETAWSGRMGIRLMREACHVGTQGEGAPVPLGFFRELGPSPASALSVQEAIGQGPTPELQRRAAFYLVQGTCVAAVMGMLPDVLDGEQIFLSESIVSDGDWFWRRDLAHYVAKVQHRASRGVPRTCCLVPMVARGASRGRPQAFRGDRPSLRVERRRSHRLTRARRRGVTERATGAALARPRPALWGWR